MVDFTKFSLMSQLPEGGPSMQPPARPAPQPAPQPRLPGILGLLFGNQFDIGQGILGALFGKKQTPSTTDKAVIDRRPEEMQRLVSMFNPGGPK